ncbi:EamA family transporter [Microvirga tunisiensis]|uniref:EamA family transporter n=2 Tax=Pannonibacter tanglangensis TaxID=2750084 RepID=A0ABW9ZK02_9HYPH|nr:MULTISPECIES: DMT family transporter [unclassified Pannonibacter]NBN65230.1 EamA family transporter [Pannonibacter sp. XCT-34]NBN79793.1 EamA family transporter [Pannonibacter sp. XCT-53]
MNLISWLLLAALSALWGGAFLFAKVAVSEIPPFVLVFLRVAIAVALLQGVLYLSRQRLPSDRSSLGAFLLLGLLNNVVPFSLIFWGQTGIAAGLASILNATTPMFTFLVAAVLFRQEEVSLSRIAGVLLGFAGVAAMLSASLAGLTSDPLWAQAACLGAAVSYAFAGAFGRRFRGTPPLVTATGQLTASTLIMAPVALLTAGSWSPVDVSLLVWGNVLALGVFATALAYLLFFRLLARAGATNTSLVTLLIPVCALLFGHLLLGERLYPVQFAGLAVLLAGLVLLDGRAVRALIAARR